MNFSYDEYAAIQAKAAKGTNLPKIGWFKLAPEQEAIIRMDIASLDDLQFSTVHTLHTKDNRWMRVNCLNQLGQYGDNCPLCTAAEAGASDISRASKKVYVKLLVSYKDPVTGTFATPVPVIWERSAGFAKEIISYLKDYGNLKETLLKVSRQGTGMDTKYVITYAVPAIFKPDMIPTDFSAFDSFKLERHSYWEKTKEEMESFLIDGVFPEVAKQEDQTTIKTNTVNSVPTTSSTVAATVGAPTVETVDAKKIEDQSQQTVTKDFSKFSF